MPRTERDIIAGQNGQLTLAQLYALVCSTPWSKART